MGYIKVSKSYLYNQIEEKESKLKEAIEIIKELLYVITIVVKPGDEVNFDISEKIIQKAKEFDKRSIGDVLMKEQKKYNIDLSHNCKNHKHKVSAADCLDCYIKNKKYKIYNDREDCQIHNFIKEETIGCRQ